MAARDQVLQQRAREAIFDLDALAVLERIGGVAAGQEARRLDRRLRAELAVDHAGDDVVDRHRNPRVARAAHRQPRHFFAGRVASRTPASARSPCSIASAARGCRTRPAVVRFDRR